MSINTFKTFEKNTLHAAVGAVFLSYVGMHPLQSTTTSKTFCVITNVYSNISNHERQYSPVDVYDSVTTAPQLSKNFNTLEAIRNLKDGWFNGQIGERNAFSDELVDKVKKIISKLKNQPEVFPTGRDSIQIEFENENGDYLEFEFYENGKISKYYENSIKSYSRGVSEKNIYKSVKEFYAK